MTYLLYGARGSGSCTVECAGRDRGGREVRKLSLRNDEQRGKRLRGGQSAAQDPGRHRLGPVLTESVAILLTLDERHPEAGLLPPKGSVERAQALRWLLFAATEIYPVVEINDYPERFATDPAETDAMRERAREIWRTRWLVVEEHASGDPYFGRPPRARSRRARSRGRPAPPGAPCWAATG